MVLPNFELTAQQALSLLSKEQGIHDFHALCQWVRNLPYTRISQKSDLSLTILEHCGTCSSKHAFLKQVAIEHHQDDIELTVGIFKMSRENTPNISTVLSQYELEYIPEAHCYLYFDGERFDFTKEGIDVNNFKDEILVEQAVTPQQTGKWKVAFQQQFIQEWLLQNPQIPYTSTEIWQIREQCIAAIAQSAV